jgi:hypothetical protein
VGNLAKNNPSPDTHTNISYYYSYLGAGTNADADATMAARTMADLYMVYVGEDVCVRGVVTLLALLGGKSLQQRLGAQAYSPHNNLLVVEEYAVEEYAVDAVEEYRTYNNHYYYYYY